MAINECSCVLSLEAILTFYCAFHSIPSSYQLTNERGYRSAIDACNSAKSIKYMDNKINKKREYVSNKKKSFTHKMNEKIEVLKHDEKNLFFSYKMRMEIIKKLLDKINLFSL